MRVLICGSRTWDDADAVKAVISGLAHEHSMESGFLVIHGLARGADSAAEAAAVALGVDIDSYPAAWDEYGKAAGAIRNQRMLDEGRPDVVWAFADDLANSKGTADMVRRARKAGVPVYVVSREE